MYFHVHIEILFEDRHILTYEADVSTDATPNDVWIDLAARFPELRVLQGYDYEPLLNGLPCNKHVVFGYYGHSPAYVLTFKTFTPFEVYTRYLSTSEVAVLN